MRVLADRPCAESRGKNTVSYDVKVIESRIGGDKQLSIAIKQR